MSEILNKYTSFNHSPAPRSFDEDEQKVQSGTFGLPDDENHNAYETNICPYTTMRFVELSAMEEHQDEWQPLPANLMPQGGIATTDFLGYGSIPRLHAERRETLCIGHFDEGDDVAGRLRYNTALFTRCNTELDKLSETFKMVRLGLDNDSRKYVKFKSEPGNLVFCETVDNTVPLRDRRIGPGVSSVNPTG